jgi:hypothetical protein
LFDFRKGFNMIKIHILARTWIVAFLCAGMLCIIGCCPPYCEGTAPCEGPPTYNPNPWNIPSVVSSNNCYNYGTNIQTNTYAQPGQASGASHSTTCPTVDSAAKSDGLTQGSSIYCHSCSHKVALVIAPGPGGSSPYKEDYHWYRQDDNGKWSHKPGPGLATNLDASGNVITNPETADRKYVHGPDYILDYSVFCGYLCVDRQDVNIN